MANSCVARCGSSLSIQAGATRQVGPQETSVRVEKQCRPSSACCIGYVTTDSGSLKSRVAKSAAAAQHSPTCCKICNSTISPSHLAKNHSDSSQNSLTKNGQKRDIYRKCMSMHVVNRVRHSVKPADRADRKSSKFCTNVWLDSRHHQHCVRDDVSICRREVDTVCSVAPHRDRHAETGGRSSSLSIVSHCLRTMPGWSSSVSTVRKWGHLAVVTAEITSGDRPPPSSPPADTVDADGPFPTTTMTTEAPPELPSDLQCVETGSGDVECVLVKEDGSVVTAKRSPAMMAAGKSTAASTFNGQSLAQSIGEALLLISPFFFWGTSMVVMKQILPKVGPLFLASVRLIPAGMLVVGFGVWQKRRMPAGALAWTTIILFALVDGTLFQGFLAEGLQRTSAGLGSVIIDSQPLTVAVLATLFFGESLGPLGVLGLLLGVLGLCLIEVPLDVLLGFFKSSVTSPVASSVPGIGTGMAGALSDAVAGVVAQGPAAEIGTQGRSLWDAGEFWMLLAAQSMAVGTVMVRWVCKYNDSIMATGWHMILGGAPLLLLSLYNQEPVLSGGGYVADLTAGDIAGLLYASIFGSAVSYGVFFYNANRGSLTKLSSLTFLTPMFATLFGYLFLGEVLSEVQLIGAATTLVAISLVNSHPSSPDSDEAVLSKDD
ncbi:hypothetical protein CBR_g22386 [Chara braunii]|uniref:EamA domain-containing protein n=1 Tax=Chara braunii TaxID=69332 RepID=A0A388JUU4_CHABU|nr:hypothetical protein CBR_g22386 [Chara braunii]|eukprot:GBG61589.1 hypothetical protein CBR_g22386 [Chara braunii]